MIPAKEFVNIVEGLYQKTCKEKVDWKPEEHNKDKFWLELPRSKIRLEYRSPATEPDYIDVTLWQADGKLVGGLKIFEGEPGWESAERLYWLVNKQVLGWDKVLEDVHRFLGTAEES